MYWLSFSENNCENENENKNKRLRVLESFEINKEKLVKMIQ